MSTHFIRSGIEMCFRPGNASYTSSLATATLQELPGNREFHGTLKKRQLMHLLFPLLCETSSLETSHQETAGAPALKYSNYFLFQKLLFLAKITYL